MLADANLRLVMMPWDHRVDCRSKGSALIRRIAVLSGRGRHRVRIIVTVAVSVVTVDVAILTVVHTSQHQHCCAQAAAGRVDADGRGCLPNLAEALHSSGGSELVASCMLQGPPRGGKARHSALAVPSGGNVLPTWGRANRSRHDFIGIWFSSRLFSVLTLFALMGNQPIAAVWRASIQPR